MYSTAVYLVCRFDETVNATNSDGKSALQLALEGGKIFRAKKLLAVGAGM